MTQLVPLAAQEGTVMLADHNPTGGRLEAWAQAAHAAAMLGTALSKTSFVPATFRNKPEECAAAILFGDEIGLSPTQAVQSVFVIGGKPGMYARTMVAIVLAAGHSVETVTKTDSKVTVRGRRKGSETWIEETWTTERARRAGYTNNKKYETDPQSMLYARAASDICRQVAPDALAGIGYSVEELELAEVPTGRVVRSETTAGKTTIKRKAPEPIAPSFDEEPTLTVVQDEPDTEPAPPITSAQSKRMAELMLAAGISKSDALDFCITTIGRPISSSKELTILEADEVLEGLQALADLEAGTEQPEEQE